MEAMRRPIVVVDDEPDVLDLLCQILQDEGYAVVCHAHPREVAADPCDVALFLLDLMLPTMTGIALARQLRGTGFPHTPMIAMSASRDMLEDASQSHLFQGMLAKPFDLNGLLTYAERYGRHADDTERAALATTSH
jgi:CheY-like chemotaxis protein